MASFKPGSKAKPGTAPKGVFVRLPDEIHAALVQISTAEKRSLQYIAETVLTDWAKRRRRRKAA